MLLFSWKTVSDQFSLFDYIISSSWKLQIFLTNKQQLLSALEHFFLKCVQFWDKSSSSSYTVWNFYFIIEIKRHLTLMRSTQNSFQNINRWNLQAAHHSPCCEKWPFDCPLAELTSWPLSDLHLVWFIDGLGPVQTGRESTERFCFLSSRWRDFVLQSSRREAVRGDFLTQRNVTPYHHSTNDNNSQFIEFKSRMQL